MHAEKYRVRFKRKGTLNRESGLEIREHKPVVKDMINSASKHPIVSLIVSKGEQD